MIVRIGVAQSPKELEVDLGDDAAQDDVKKLVAEAMADDENTLWLTDRKGRTVGVPSARLAYVEIGAPQDGPRIGFGA
jgi:hypothetical protein